MRILVISGGLQVGGLTSSLVSFLGALSLKQIEVDLYLENKEDVVKLPQTVSVVDVPQFSRIVDGYHGVRRIVYMVRNGTFFDMLRQRIVAWLPMGDRACKQKLNMKLYQKRELRKSLSSHILVDLEDKYDIVISWEELLPTYILANNVKCKKKYAWIHPDYIGAGFSAEVDRASFEKLDGIVAVSEAGRSTLQKVFPDFKDKIYSMHNLLDVDSIRSKSVEFTPNYSAGVFQLVTVARLQNVSKAYDRALRIVKKLAAMDYKFLWHFIGDGEDRGMLENYICENGLLDYVKLHGMQDNPYPYMKAADLLVLQSYYEGKPIVVDEAMVLGTPVLVTNYASAMEQVRDHTDGLIVNNNEEDIFGGIKSILDNPALLQCYKQNIMAKDFSYLTSIEPFLHMIAD